MKSNWKSTNTRDDVYHDRARIPENFRGGIREGRICKVRAGEHATLLEIRGLQGETRKIIRLDDKTRDDLHLDVLHSYDFSLRPRLEGGPVSLGMERFRFRV